MLHNMAEVVKLREGGPNRFDRKREKTRVDLLKAAGIVGESTDGPGGVRYSLTGR